MTRSNIAQKLLAPVFALLTAFVFLTADLNSQAQNANSGTAEGAAPQAGNASGSPGAEHDMSGTFTGTIDAPALNLSGPATVTFTTNTVTISTEGGGSASGTYFAREWPGEIALSIRFGTTFPADIYSLRARHRGQSLWLSTVPGESKQFSFRTAGGGGGGRRRRGRRAADATSTGDATDAGTTAGNTNDNTGAAENTNSGEANANTGGTGRRRGRRGTRRGGNTNANANTNTGGNTNNSNTPPPLR